MLVCECGGKEFYARQVATMDVITDGNGNWIKNMEVSAADKPYGPFTCTKCEKEYEELGGGNV